MKTKSTIISLLSVLFAIAILFASCQKESIKPEKKSVPTVALQKGNSIGDGTVSTPTPEPR
jgi:uncharacterized lipoprotein YajG